MPRRKALERPRFTRWLSPSLHAARIWATAVVRQGWRRLRRLRRPSPHVAVLLTDAPRRRCLERHVRGALGQLQRTITLPIPGEVAVVVQQVITTDRQLAGCCQIVQRPEGGRFSLLRLALQVNDRPVGLDELLAVLAEQYLGLAAQMSGASSILVPVELEVTPSTSRQSTLPADPLALHRNGHGPAAALPREHAS